MTFESLKRFKDSLKKFTTSAVPGDIERLQRFICLTALKKLVEMTPADIGTARGNWQVTIGAPTFDAIGLEDPSGTEAIGKGSAVIEALGPFQLCVIQNNTEYIEVLENGGFIPPDPGPSKDRRPDRKGKILVVGGYSTQAPNGMLKVTFESITTRLAS